MHTLLILSIAATILYLIFKAHFLIWITLTLLLLASFKNPVADMIERVWLGFARIIGTINSKILLTLTFYLILTPVALITRIFNKAIRRNFFGMNENTYWHKTDKSFTKKDFTELW